MVLKILFTVHAIVTLAAGIVLMAAPAFIPSTVNIQLPKDAFLLSYFLGAAEIALAFLSFFAGRLKNAEAIRLVACCFVVFHLLTAATEVYAIMQGADKGLWANVLVRVLVSSLFIYFGVYKVRKDPIRS